MIKQLVSAVLCTGIIAAVLAAAPVTTSAVNNGAVKNGAIKNGDVNGNGTIAGDDLLIVEQNLLGVKVLGYEELPYADLNTDGLADATDSLLLKQHLLGLNKLAANVTRVYSGTRDVWLWPFSQNSIWNTPIGSDAQYSPAGFVNASHIALDYEIHSKSEPGDPERTIYNVKSWKPRWIGTKVLGTMNLPDDLIIPESGGNNCAAFLMPDGHTLKQLCAATRISAGSDICGYYSSWTDLDIYGAGVTGGHGGSGMSSIGGSIRSGELTGDGQMHHALKLDVRASQYCYYGDDVKGYVWPAVVCDSYANSTSNSNAYGGTNPLIAMGTLLALPADATPESLGITSEPGKKIFYALRDYGCYIVDDTTWDSFTLAATYGVSEELEVKYGYKFESYDGYPTPLYNDMMKMMTSLCVITNNTPSSVGGGGTPCRPLAPQIQE